MISKGYTSTILILICVCLSLILAAELEGGQLIERDLENALQAIPPASPSRTSFSCKMDGTSLYVISVLYCMFLGFSWIIAVIAVASCSAVTQCAYFIHTRGFRHFIDSCFNSLEGCVTSAGTAFDNCLDGITWVGNAFDRCALEGGRNCGLCMDNFQEGFERFLHRSGLLRQEDSNE